MSGKKEEVRMNQWAYRFLKPLIHMVIGVLFNLKPRMPEEVKQLKPPYLLMPTHQGFWDPFMAAFFIHKPVFFITSDAVFRSSFFKFIVQLAGAIPKTKAKSDIDALKNIIRIKDQGGVIGIFPEGRRNWDGVTLPLVYSTSKLIRMLKIPVVTLTFKGGFFSQPRWGKHIQRGRVEMEYRLLFTSDDLKGAKADEIHRKLADALSFNEYTHQREEMVKFRGRKPAENIEQLLFACPSCGGFDTLSSSGRYVKCSSCGYEVRLNSYMFFEQVEKALVFDNVRDWNLWQLEHLEKLLAEKVDHDNGEKRGDLILKESGAVISTGFRIQKLNELTRGSLAIYNQTLVIEDNDGQEIVSFFIPALSGVNVQNKEILEFYNEGTLYSIKGQHKRFNSHKWLKILEYIQKDKVASFQAD